MTVIIDTLQDLAGAPETDAIAFSTYAIRDSADGTSIVTTSVHTYTPVDGVLTTGDLEPGPARVRIGAQVYGITIPDSGTPIRLMPLIVAGLPIPPGEEATAIRDGGGFALGTVMTAAEYSALVASTTPNPGSVFFVY